MKSIDTLDRRMLLFELYPIKRKAAAIIPKIVDKSQRTLILDNTIPLKHRLVSKTRTNMARVT